MAGVSKKATMKELAFALFDEGKRPRDQEVKGVVKKSGVRYKYFQMWKRDKEAAGEAILDGEESTVEEESSSSKGATPAKAASGRGSVDVGKIVISVENWVISQYGAVVILDTYKKAKRDLGYDGTVGEFLCDITRFYRRVLAYEEVQNDGQEGSVRGRGDNEDAEEGIGAEGRILG